MSEIIEKLKIRKIKLEKELEGLTKIQQEHYQRIQESQNALNNINQQGLAAKAKLDEINDLLEEKPAE